MWCRVWCVGTLLAVCCLLFGCLAAWLARCLRLVCCAGSRRQLAWTRLIASGADATQVCVDWRMGALVVCYGRDSLMTNMTTAPLCSLTRRSNATCVNRATLAGQNHNRRAAELRARSNLMDPTRLPTLEAGSRTRPPVGGEPVARAARRATGQLEQAARAFGRRSGGVRAAACDCDAARNPNRCCARTQAAAEC